MARFQKMASIDPHLDNLKTLIFTKGLKKIYEIGVHRGNSTLAILSTLPPGGTLTSIDIIPPLIEINDPNWKFIQRDSLDVFINEKIDLLLIDGEHTYFQVSQELEHYSKWTKYIAMHDTQTPGVFTALGEFLSKHKEWTIKHQVNYSLGFTIIQNGP